MIKLSRLSDYAVVVLETMSRVSGAEPMSASQIALESFLPEPTVAKVLKLMANGGLVSSQRGVNGGYTLCHEPASITVYTIITSIEGRLGLTACVEGADEGGCSLHHTCAMQGRWDLVNHAVQRAFESITLADMMSARITKKVV